MPWHTKANKFPPCIPERFRSNSIFDDKSPGKSPKSTRDSHNHGDEIYLPCLTVFNFLNINFTLPSLQFIGLPGNIIKWRPSQSSDFTQYMRWGSVSLCRGNPRREGCDSHSTPPYYWSGL